MIVLNIYDNQLIAQSNAVADGVKFETVKFNFPDNWLGYGKTAVFKNADGLVLNVVLNSENPLCVDDCECYIPHEMLKNDKFWISVFGVLGESLATTTEAEIVVLESGYANGGEPEEPTPSIYQQLNELMEATKQVALSVREDADNGVFNGKIGEKGERGEKGEKGDKGDQGEVSLEYLNKGFAPVITNTASGKQLRIKDVSEIEHELKINVSGADNVTVHRYGKNIFDLSHLAKEYTFRYNGYSQKYGVSHLRGKSITFQISVDFSRTVEENAYISATLYWFDESGQTLKSSYGTVVKPTSAANIAYVTAQIPSTAYYVGFGVGVFFDGTNAPQTGSSITLYNPQAEFDTVPTEYEPFTVQTAVSNAEGKVLGLTSVSPVTILLSDSTDAVLSLEYNADTKRYIDNKFAELQAIILEG